MTNFKVIENQTHEVERFDNKIDAIQFARRRHGRNMQRHHAVLRFSPSFGWVEQTQWKLGDCSECHRRCYPTHNIAEEAVYMCDYCDIEIPFSDLDPSIRVCDRMTKRHSVKRCPQCGNQFPISFDACIYCRRDLRDVDPTEYVPFGVCDKV